ncbi:hypothetical protein AG1IA_06568 [Rhizoctonia solani AG-1 IA]|uniref:Uncharacterized protein n=1 Tax=Thanatephorus cucumeris (strain AG1-IA) TaxID=983506 RepID=L8WMM9_THACA|nr:hypothetical protein AG1IA_06568 [Rhizoctonia solani AG-1 IA]
MLISANLESSVLSSNRSICTIITFLVYHCASLTLSNFSLSYDAFSHLVARYSSTNHRFEVSWNLLLHSCFIHETLRILASIFHL